MNKYEAFLNALGDLYYTIYAIDIVNDRMEVIKALDTTIDVMPDDESANERLKKLTGIFASKEYQKVVTRFVDVTKWRKLLEDEPKLKLDYINSDGYWRRAWIVPSNRDQDGRVTDVVLCIRDINKEKLEELSRERELDEARTDALTGFKNRKSFYEDIENVKSDQTKRDQSVGLVFVDINGLKAANDNYGHEAGDKLICAVADILKEVFRNSQIYRHGGDEFLVLSFAKSSGEFEDEIDLLSDMWTEQISAAVGSVWVDHMAEISESIAVADRRMYLDKNTYYQQKAHDRRKRDNNNAPQEDRRSIDVNSLVQVPFAGLDAPDEKRHYCLSDLTTGITRWSKSAVEYFGLSSEYMANAEEEWAKHIHPEDRADFQQSMEGIFNGTVFTHKMDYRALNRYGEYVVCTCSGNVVPAISGNGYVFIAAIDNHGVSELFDSVTGLSNIYSFMRDTSVYLNLSGHDMILALGINDYASINKAYGYEVGNRLLKLFADELRALAGLGALAKVYRMEGVKFCIAMHEASVEHLRSIYEKIQSIAKQGFKVDGKSISFSVSGGVVCVDDGDETADEFTIIGSLNYVIDSSKHKEHGELVIFNDDLVSGSVKNLEILSSIRNSIADGMAGFFLCYQPIVEAMSGRITGMEALIRWNKEPYGLVSPAIFIDWLENDPCFYDLGAWVLKKALTDALPIVKKRPDFVVNVNVSAEQIERSGFRKLVEDTVKEMQFPTENICFELTERVVSLDIAFLRDELNFFRNMGIQIALDDFGTGVSSLNLLLELPVDHLKIDRSFVKDIITNKTEQILVETIANCASGMELDVCAEGIETNEMKEFLKNYKIQKHQGYLYSKPVTYDKFLRILECNE